MMAYFTLARSAAVARVRSVSWYWLSVSPSAGAPEGSPTVSVTTSKYWPATSVSKHGAMLAGVVPKKLEDPAVKS